MKRKIVIATAAAVALIGGGTASAVGFAGGGDGTAAQPAQASARLSADDSRDDRDDRDDRDEADDDRDDNGRVDDHGRSDAGRAGAAKVAAPEAAAAALKAAPGTVTGIDLDDDASRRLVWDVDVLGNDGTWREVTVDADSGRVLRQGTDDEDDAREARAALRGASVDAAEAARRAASKGTVTSVDLDDGGRPGAFWEVETAGAHGKEHEFAVALDSGQVTTRASDDDSDGHDDHGGSDDD